jgi:hypothetical protein
MTLPDLTAAFEILFSQSHLLITGAFGGLILCGTKVAAHFNKLSEDKLSAVRYSGWLLFILIVLPFLGLALVGVYILNGDKLSAVLALQVGLTSPAIITSLMSVTANGMAKGIAATAPGQ